MQTHRDRHQTDKHMTEKRGERERKSAQSARERESEKIYSPALSIVIMPPKRGASTRKGADNKRARTAKSAGRERLMQLAA